MSFSHPPTVGNNNIFDNLSSGSVGVATLKINREQIEKVGFGGWLLQEAENKSAQSNSAYCYCGLMNELMTFVVKVLPISRVDFVSSFDPKEFVHKQVGTNI